MKVLYITDNYPHLSETYIRTEIEFMLRQGVEVAVWTRTISGNSYPTPCPIYEGSPFNLIKEFKPDVIHVHWVNLACEMVEFLGSVGVPVTVRGHTFDVSQKAVESLLGHPHVSKIYLFPHFCEEFSLDPVRVIPMTACFDPEQFPRRVTHSDGGKGMVYRAGAGVRGKALEEFILIARQSSPHLQFVLSVTTSCHDQGYVMDLHRLNALSNRPVSMQGDLARPAIAAYMRMFDIYLRGHDPSGHRYGMPVSIAEAMGSGMVVVYRRCPEADRYIGDAGIGYNHRDQVIDILERLYQSTDMKALSEKAMKRSEQFEVSKVLSPMLKDWEVISRR